MQKSDITRPPGHDGRASQTTLRIGATLAVPDILRSLGADPAEVLAEVGVELDLFDDPGNLISFEERGRLLAHCANRTSCPHFGLLVGQRSDLDALGLVGLLARYSPTAGSALQSLTRYLYHHVRGALAVLKTEVPGIAVMEYQIRQGGAPGNRQVGDGAVAVIVNILRELCGDDWEPAELRFAHRKPVNLAPYHRFFRAPLRFDAGEYSVVFPAAWLDQPVAGSSSQLLFLLQQEIEKLDAKQTKDLTEQVRSLLRTTLLTGHGSADQIAGFLSMHRRTLTRRLKARGTSFRDLVGEVSLEISRQLLEDSDMEIIEIASLLGYSNASAFTRAFRRWSSTTPAIWRTRARRTE
jgi:AraC-like DNA-binding protein